MTKKKLSGKVIDISQYVSGKKDKKKDGQGILTFEDGNPIYEERQTQCSYTVGKCMEDVEFDEDGKAESIYGYLSCG